MISFRLIVNGSDIVYMTHLFPLPFLSNGIKLIETGISGLLYWICAFQIKTMTGQTFCYLIQVHPWLYHTCTTYAKFLNYNFLFHCQWIVFFYIQKIDPMSIILKGKWPTTKSLELQLRIRNSIVRIIFMQ